VYATHKAMGMHRGFGRAVECNHDVEGALT